MIRLKASDTLWSHGKGPLSLQIGLCTFGILSLELALIRWTSSQIRIFAYFNNLVLIGAFLGMGLGVATGRRHPGLVHWVLPILFLACMPFAFSEQLDIVRMSFPDETISLWGAEIARGGLPIFVRNLAIFLALFCMLVAVFVCAGAPVGYLFPKLPPLKAYSADLMGSLLGIIAFTAATFLNAHPPVWFAVGCMPFVWLSRRLTSLGALAGILLLASISINGAIFSPYNRIDIVKTADRIRLNVNRDFHQYIHDFSPSNLRDGRHSPASLSELTSFRDMYDVPFVIGDNRGRVLIVGAGTGNDAQAALRNGYKPVFSVDIDDKIIQLGRRLHPEKPYDHPSVVPIVNDARAFFEQYRGEPFDVVCFGFLDSHAMFSSMSSLRLDNYVYTEEGIRSAWNLVADGGHLSIAISVYAGQWFVDRMYWTITKATGKEPYVMAHTRHYGATFIVPKQDAVIHWQRIAQYPRLIPLLSAADTVTTSDNWPFLFIKPGHFPWGYVIVLSAVMLLAVASIASAFGPGAIGRDLDLGLFLMGAAFLLIETRGVTSLSLLFGSTWIVNASIFSGILTMVWIANQMARHWVLENPKPWFLLLFISVVLVWTFNVGSLNSLSLTLRGIVGGLLVALPIGFAGVIVSILLRTSSDPTASLGANLLGAVLGGCLEYLSMSLGLEALAQLALLIYFLAFLVFLRRFSGPAPEDGG